MGIGKAELQDSILGNEELPGFFQEVVLGYKFMLHKDRLIELGLILGGRFLGQAYGFKGGDFAHVDHQWSVFSNLQIFF